MPVRNRKLRWIAVHLLLICRLCNATTLETTPQHVMSSIKISDATLPACRLKKSTGNLGEGFGLDLGAPYVPSIGTLNAYMIFVDFPDAPANDSLDALYGVFAPGAPDWYHRSSFGKLTLEITAAMDQFYRMPHDSTSYTWHRGMPGEEHLRYVGDALHSVGESINFTGTDILYIVPTAAASHISYSPTLLASVIAADGTWINKTVTFGQDIYEWGFKVMNHETGHAMGLPDLYPGRWNPGPVGQFVGGFDLMADILGASPDLFAWHKWRLGWLFDDQLECLTDAGASDHHITAGELQGGKKAVIVKYNETTVVVAEARSAVGLNRDACGVGVLIYIVYTNIESGFGPIMVQDAAPASGGCKGEELNDAPFRPGGDPFVCPELGLAITVVNATGVGYHIRVEVL